MKYLILSLAVAVSFGQGNQQNYQAELSIPFGTVRGQLLTTPSILVFYDVERPGSSFVMERRQVAGLSADGVRVTITTSEPVADRSGARSEFVFRLLDSTSAAALVGWGKVTDPAPPNKVADAATKSFEVRHKHFVGTCSGRLILGDDRLVFESISDLDHSRRWAIQDIKELKRSGQYRLKVVPFTGDSYDFDLLGKGMEADDFKSLVDLVTRARSKK